MLKASLSGQVRQTHLPKWKPLLPLFEAVMNSFQAIQEQNPSNPLITVNLHREPELELGTPGRIQAFTVVDNGIGFTDENMDSFNTAFSEYKHNQGGKGLGRFLWLKAFTHVDIDSTFIERPARDLIRRQFTFDEQYDPDTVEVSVSDKAAPGTTLSLIGFREPYRSEAPIDLDHIARRMCEHFILILMQPEIVRGWNYGTALPRSP
jgi:hypothetical protein